jgi:hypothetical protein
VESEGFFIPLFNAIILISNACSPFIFKSNQKGMHG